MAKGPSSALLLLAVAALMAGAGLVSAQTDEIPDQPDPAAVRDKILATPGSPITFYGHVFGIGRTTPMPMNTQYPINEDDYSRGVFGSCGRLNGVPVYPLGPDPSSLGTQHEDCIASYQGNENYFYTTAGFVQVKNADEWGSDYGKFHNERGQTKDIYFDTSQTIHVQYHMSADAHGWSTAFCGVGACWNWDPGAFQDWVVEATVYHANLGNWSADPSTEPDMTAVAAGGDAITKVAYGASVPQDIVSMDATVPVVGGQTVFPFDFDLVWEPDFVAADGRIPFDENLIVRVEWYQETNPGERYILTPGFQVAIAWNVNSGEDYPPTFTFPVRNPMDVELVYPRFVHDKLVVLAIINTPWGSYDIDSGLTTLEVKDANGATVDIPEQFLKTTLDSSVSHGGHYKPINGTWIWDYQAQGLAPGDYTITVSTSNFQHSYTAATTASFTISADGTGGATGVGRGGLQSFDEGEFEVFQDSAGGGVDVTTAPTDSTTEAKDSPGAGLVAGLAAALGAVALRRRFLS